LKTINIKIYFIIIAISLFTSCGDEPKAKQKKIEVKISKHYTISQVTKVSKKIDAIYARAKKRHDFNGSILVAKKGQILINKEYGYADFKKKTLLDSTYSFQLASVSKQFTAIAILMLYEQHKLDLEDKITKYFSDFPYPEITIKQCLSHTSGLSKYFWLVEHKWEEDYPPSNEEVMEMIEDYKLPLFFSSGKKYVYSNTNYLVLASIIEEITGDSYADFLQENIFEPLKMNNSFVYSFGKSAEKPNQLWGYRIYKYRYHIKIPGTVNDGVVGDKNVFSTATDLNKWVNGLNSGKLISKELLKEAYSQAKTSKGREIEYGYGFHIKYKDGIKKVYHNGKWNGFRTSITQYPSDSLTIIFLEHSSYQSISSLIRATKRVVDEELR